MRNESIRLKERGIDIVVVLSHCGLKTDYEIARNGGSYIDVIVGGHSHSFLYTGSHPPGPDKREDEYPVVITQSDGRKVIANHFWHTNFVENNLFPFQRFSLCRRPLTQNTLAI